MTKATSLLNALLNTPFKLKKGSDFNDMGTDSDIWYIKEVGENGEVAVSSLSAKQRQEAYDKDDEKTIENEQEMAWVSTDDLRLFKKR